MLPRRPAASPVFQSYSSRECCHKSNTVVLRHPASEACVRSKYMINEMILNCSRQIFFENDSEDYKYSGCGTCFIVSFRDSFYAITAAHVIKSFEDEQVIILYNDKSDLFLPLKRVSIPNLKDIDDTDHQDIVIYKIENDKLEKNEKFTEYYTIENTNFSLFEECCKDNSNKIIISGYPHEINGICYENKIIKSQQFVISGNIIENTRCRGLHRIKYDKPSRINNFDGLSGSPVFLLCPYSDYYELILIGILLRKACFLEFSIIYKMLSCIEKDITNL